MLLLNLELRNVNYNSVKDEEVIDLEVEATKDSYLVDKLIDRYSGIDNLQDSVDELWELREAIREHKVPDVDYVDLGDYSLEVTVINKDYLPNVIAEFYYSKNTYDLRCKIENSIKNGDLVVDEFYARDEDHARYRYLELHEETSEDDLEHMISSGKIRFINVVENYWISVESI